MELYVFGLGLTCVSRPVECAEAGLRIFISVLKYARVEHKITLGKYFKHVSRDHSNARHNTKELYIMIYDD